jgi:hypothetical protein
MNVLQLPTLHRHESVPDVMAAILGSRPAPGQPPGMKKARGGNCGYFLANARKNADQSRHFECS